MRPSRLLIFLAALMLWSALPTPAQISPGPLSRAHQSLSRTSNCTTCHKLGGEATFKCVACHTEIGNRVTARKGLHASYKLNPGSSQECVRCHSEHNGEDFPLIKWDIRTFDHKQTGYALEGKHVGVACNRCHSAQHIAQSERQAIKVNDPNKAFLGVSTN
jgi:Class III cytochrome C family